MLHLAGFLAALVAVFALCAWLSWLVPRKVAALLPPSGSRRRHAWWRASSAPSAATAAWLDAAAQAILRRIGQHSS